MSAATELQNIVGYEKMQMICSMFGGGTIYIPETPPGRAKLILHEFDEVVPLCASVQSAYETVAKEFDVSTRTVQRVVCAG